MPSANLTSANANPAHTRSIRDLLGPGGVRGSNLFGHDETLQALLLRNQPQLLQKFGQQLSDFGSWVGSAVDSQAEYSDAHAPPRLESYDRRGNTVNRVQHNPQYTQCQRELYKRGIIASDGGKAPSPTPISLSMGYLLAQADLSLHLSASLSAAVVLVLQQYAPDELRRLWLPRLLRRDGTALTASIWNSGHACPGTRTASCSTALPTSQGDGITLQGIERAADVPDCDLALLCAYDDNGNSNGPGLYLLPRQTDDHRLNKFLVRQLKTTTGTRGLATGEIELRDAWALPVAAAPAGSAALQTATALIRLHAAFAAAASQRRFLLECLDFSAYRHHKGRRLPRHAMTQDKLLMLRCEYEADMELLFAAAEDFDRAIHAPQQSGWQRMLVCLAKFRSSRNAMDAGITTLALFGDQGNNEAYPVARLHRDSLVLNRWGGTATDLISEGMLLLSPRFNLKDRFGQYMRDLLDQAPMRVTRLSAGMRKGLAEYQEITRYLHRFPESSDRLGTSLLTLMSDLLAGALLLRTAGNEINAGDARRTLMLQAFLQRHFPETTSSFTIKTNKLLSQFDALITGSPIDADSGWEQCFKNRL